MKSKQAVMLFLLLALIQLLFSVINIPKASNKINSEGMKKGRWVVLCDSTNNEVTDPKLATYYRVIDYKKGKPQGKVTDYYLSGKKKAETTYNDGELSEVIIEWNEDGSYQAGNYLNGKREGVWTFWYLNGKRLKEGLFKNGKEEGKWTFWHANGYKKEEGEFLNGERNGFWKAWNLDYSWAEGNYEHGKKVGKWASLSAD